MLSPEYIQNLTNGAEELTSDLHTRVVIKIIERILRRFERGDEYILTAIDKWQLETLQQAGFLLEDIQKEIAQVTPHTLKEIQKAFEDAGVKALAYDDAVYKAAGLSPTPLKQSPHMIRLMQRNYDKTAGEFKNLCGTFANAAQQTFIKECDAAYNLVTSGAVSYTEAYRDAIKAIAKDVVRIDYPSGHSDTIETATLRCIRTGVSQATADITNARLDEMDWDIVLVSSHFGARYGDGGENYTNHAWWQGKFYSRSGKDKRFLPFSVCGQGNVQGINGANCRHSYGVGDGIHNPYEHFDTEENRKEYDLSQRQRQLERRIRGTKREAMGLKSALDNAKTPEERAAFQADYDKAARKLTKQNKAYNDFCKEHDRKKLYDRTTIAGWDKKQAAAASGAARRSARLTAAKENAILKAKKRIGTEEFPLKVNIGNQNKHISTSHSYDETEHKSIIFGDMQTAIDLFNRYHGEGEFRLSNKLEWVKKEFVTAENDIGVTFDLESGKYVPTNRFAIHFGKKGWHIVPVKRGKD